MRNRKGEGEGKGTYEGFTVWLMDAVLHCFVYKFRIGRRASKSGGEHGKTLHVEYLSINA